jgi:predicted dithiol-disulfide oxidoreductase (DUF899 family)
LPSRVIVVVLCSGLVTEQFTGDGGLSAGCRRMLIGYFHMWHDGRPFEDQCEGCTFSTCHMQMLDYLHARDVTYAVFCQGPYDDSAAFAEFMGYTFPWYSAKDSDPALADGRGFGFIACYLRDGNRVDETYWTTGRGVEALMTSYHALDPTCTAGKRTGRTHLKVGHGSADTPGGSTAAPPRNGHARASRRR